MPAIDGRFTSTAARLEPAGACDIDLATKPDAVEVSSGAVEPAAGRDVDLAWQPG